jgi:hypothetical protein
LECVARPKSTELSERNDVIFEMAAQGYSQRKIASTMGISPARVSQVLTEARQAIDPDSARARLGEILDELLEEAMKLAHGPGKRVITPSGKPAYELDPDNISARGEPRPDLDRPVYDEYAKLEAIRQINDITRNYANTFGLVIKPKEKVEDALLVEVMTHLERLQSENREMSARLEQYEAIEGEIVGLPGLSRAESGHDGILPGFAQALLAGFMHAGFAPGEAMTDLALPLRHLTHPCKSV